MATLHGRKLTETLYQWFCCVKKTLSYETAGNLLLSTLPEREAIMVLANAHELLKGEGVPWSEFVASNKSQNHEPK